MVEAGGGGTGLAWRRGREWPCPTGIMSTSLQAGAVSPPQGGVLAVGLGGPVPGGGGHIGEPAQQGGWGFVASTWSKF